MKETLQPTSNIEIRRDLYFSISKLDEGGFICPNDCGGNTFAEGVIPPGVRAAIKCAGHRFVINGELIDGDELVVTLSGDSEQLDQLMAKLSK